MFQIQEHNWSLWLWDNFKSERMSKKKKKNTHPHKENYNLLNNIINKFGIMLLCTAWSILNIKGCKGVQQPC